MITFLFTTRADGGLDFGSEYNAARFRQWAKENPGKKMKIEQIITKRSINQNRFYWLYLEQIEMETGNTANDLHEYLKRVLLTPKFITVLGKEIKIPKSTAELNKIEFGEYMEKINALTGVEIPDNEAYKEWLDSAPDVGAEYKK